MRQIFDSHWKHETKSVYDEKISPYDANKQLLIMNEANMYRMFSKNNLSLMKKLLEGEGVPLENKYAHGFTGFLNAHTLITC